MEMVPMKATAVPGQLVDFVCAYFSTERLEIDIRPVGLVTGSSGGIGSGNSSSSMETMMRLGPSVRDMLDRFPWGSRRALSLVIDAGHRQVKCRVTNPVDGMVMGELTALIQTAAKTTAAPPPSSPAGSSSFLLLLPSPLHPLPSIT